MCHFYARWEGNKTRQFERLPSKKKNELRNDFQTEIGPKRIKPTGEKKRNDVSAWSVMHSVNDTYCYDTVLCRMLLYTISYKYNYEVLKNVGLFFDG